MAGTQRELVLRFLAEPTDVNFGGKVHGGIVMKWIDQASYACATGWCGTYCVTIYVGGIRFLKPIHIGNIVELKSRVIYTGNTSMHISVDVLAGDPKDNNFQKTTHCIIVFVAMDSEGNKIPVPKWIPETEGDKDLEIYAKRLIELRKGIAEEMKERHLD